MSEVSNRSTLRRITSVEFARRMKAAHDSRSSSQYAFFIGAGCSARCGIPTASELVDLHWLPKFHQLDAPELPYDKWLKSHFPDYSTESAGRYYGEVFASVFPFPGDRQLEIERICSPATPRYGYYVLSQLLTRPDSRFRTVLTTNFDDLLIDALNLFTGRKPIVISDDLLSGFIRVSYQNPLIVKLHGDLRFRPRNTIEETTLLGTPLSVAVANVLHEMGLVFVGYGGWDRSVASLLGTLNEQDLPYGIYWAAKSEPDCLLRDWLIKRGACWIQAESFEELMVHCQVQLGLPALPEFSRLAAVMASIDADFAEFSTSSRVSPAEATPEQVALAKALDHIETQFDSYIALADQADILAKTDTEGAEKLYVAGLRQFSDCGLAERFAIFLYRFKHDASAAEDTYRQALGKAPSDGQLQQRYARFVEEELKDLARAEAEYARAVQLGAGPACVSDRAGVLLQMGRVPEALVLLREIISPDLWTEPIARGAAMAGAVMGTFLFPGLGTLVGAHLGTLGVKSIRNLQDDHKIRDWFWLFVFGEERERSKALTNIEQRHRSGFRSRRPLTRYIELTPLEQRNKELAIELAKTITEGA